LPARTGSSANLSSVAVWLALSFALAASLSAQTARRTAPDARPDPIAALDRVMAVAEASLRENELHLAESQYRAALFDAWMTLGQLHIAGERYREARDAFRQAAASSVEADAALQSIAVLDLQIGEPGDAVAILTRLAGRARGDAGLQRLLAQAQMING